MSMELTRTQEEIRNAIFTLCAGEVPFTTSKKVASSIDISKQTVLNNEDELTALSSEIGKRKVGQANVYYVKRNRIEDIRDENTEFAAFIAPIQGNAAYVKVQLANDEPEYDLEVWWYNYEAELMESYVPSMDEVAEVAFAYSPKPVSIKYYSESTGRLQRAGLE